MFVLDSAEAAVARAARELRARRFQIAASYVKAVEPVYADAAYSDTLIGMVSTFYRDMAGFDWQRQVAPLEAKYGDRTLNAALAACGFKRTLA